jgi:hypothetical protein
MRFRAALAALRAVRQALAAAKREICTQAGDLDLLSVPCR